VRILVDTGVFSASVSLRRRIRFGRQIGLMAGQQIFLASVTVAELRHACRLAGRALHEPVHANDLWIAASAIHIEARLLTSDAVFDDVPGLALHR